MEICTVGGYEEVGKNMTAVKIGEDVILFDAGLFLPPIIEQEESEVQQKMSTEKLRRLRAIPDDLVLDKLGWTDKVRAIIVGHAHLDHVGGVPYIAHRYPKATIYATPFTMALLQNILEDERIHLPNQMKSINPDTHFMVKGKSDTYKVEFIHTTHSTLQCVFPVLHSKEGVFMYALDFKLDNFPTIENPPNYKRLKELARSGVDVLVIDALYSGTDRRTPSERIARDLIEEAFSNARGKNSAIFITTFSSHIARLKNIVDFAKQTKRQIIFLGRSVNKYVNAAIKVGKCPFRKSIQLFKYRRQVEAMLKKVESNRSKYVVVCTGHQGEPGSIMDRILKGETGFRFRKGDNVIFSSSVIPAPQNILNRSRIDRKLNSMNVRVQTDVHVSGHGSRGDLKELMLMVRPKHVIPAHGSLLQETPMIELANELGYKFGETSHLSSDGKVLSFPNLRGRK